jgi:hypothetical protein
MKKYFKRRHVLICLACAVTILICAVLSGISVFIVPAKRIYPVGATSINAVFTNAFVGRYHMSHSYTLEKYLGGVWKKVERDDKGAFFADDSFSPSLGTKISFDVTKYCDSLEEGRYRIKMTVFDRKESAREISFEFDVR